MLSLHLSESLKDRSTPPGQTSFNHAAFNCSGLQEFQQRLSELGVEYTTARVIELKRVSCSLVTLPAMGLSLTSLMNSPKAEGFTDS